ncbi:LysR substrate-binding domain-containing protein [Kitasatospora sp. NPDC091257]|uniref:LysR substrate-binding domain-containing protein n=1 Tax=Kitasatospora sp. NPDC091257 TaxID=3364084 RepID=UPI00380B3116
MLVGDAQFALDRRLGGRCRGEVGGEGVAAGIHRVVVGIAFESGGGRPVHRPGSTPGRFPSLNGTTSASGSAHPGVQYERDDIDLALLTTERLVAVVPTDHPAAGNGRVNAAALAADPLILFPRSAGAHAFEVNTQPIRDTGNDVRVAQECSNWHTIIMFVAPASASPSPSTASPRCSPRAHGASNSTGRPP